MQFTAKARFLKFSPFKLRPLVDVVRGRNVQQALHWLSVCELKRAVPIKKLIASAVANAKFVENDIDLSRLFIVDIRVDHGPSQRYFKPGPMGRASLQKRRSSHASVILKFKTNKEV